MIVHLNNYCLTCSKMLHKYLSDMAYGYGEEFATPLLSLQSVRNLKSKNQRILLQFVSYIV